MDDHLEYWCAKRRMRQMHEEAARRTLVRSLHGPLSARLACAVTRLGAWVARRGSHRQQERRGAALAGPLDVGY